MPMGGSAGMRISRHLRSLFRSLGRLSTVLRTDASSPKHQSARTQRFLITLRRLCIAFLALFTAGIASLFLPSPNFPTNPGLPFSTQQDQALPPSFDTNLSSSAVISADFPFRIIVIVPPFTGLPPPPNPAYEPPASTDILPGSETYAPRALSLLLDSLSKAFYDNENITLHLVLAPEASPKFEERYLQCASQPWTHGMKTIQNATSGGLFELAVAAWTPARADPQKVLIVDASRATPFSPQFYRYLKSVRRRYAVSPADVAGFTLEPVRVRVRTPATAITQKIEEFTSDLVRSGGVGDEVFLYQNLPFASAFSPVDADTWRTFQRWFAAHRSEWFLWPTVVGAKDKSDASWGHYRGTARAHWTLWFSRFCAEYGLYTVYPRRHRPEPLPPVGRVSALRPLSRFSFEGKSVTPQQTVGGANLEKIIELGRRQGGSVSLTVVNSAFLETARSWICNVDVANIRPPGVVWITTDDKSYEGLRDVTNSQAVRMTEFQGAQEQTGTSYGTPGYWLLMLERTQLISAILESGIGVFAFETDQVWLRDPVPFVKRLVHSGDEVDVVGTLDSRHEIGGNFLYLNPTLATRRVWREVCRRFEHAYKINKMADHTARFRKYMENDQSTLTKLIFFDQQFKTRNPVVFRALDTELFVDGRWYDEGSKIYTSAKSRSPIVINNNFLIGIYNKKRRAAQNGHWFVTQDGRTCDRRAVKKAVRDNELRATSDITIQSKDDEPPAFSEKNTDSEDASLERVQARRVEGADVEAGLDAAMVAIGKEQSQ